MVGLGKEGRKVEWITKVHSDQTLINSITHNKNNNNNNKLMKQKKFEPFLLVCSPCFIST